MEEGQLHRFLNLYMSATQHSIDHLADQSVQLILPTIPRDNVVSICSMALDKFRDGPVLLDVTSPCVVVGDIHGHILDLLRILKEFGLPEQTKYLLLGDLVDRGEFSIETVLLVFILKILYPENFFVIRGNHEFEFLCTQCGFSKQVQDDYGNELLEHFLFTFSYMPISALIDKSILCIHGGIGPSVFSVQQLRKIERPIAEFNDDFLNSLLWSDPSDNVDTFSPSTRGTGYFFGKSAVKEFVYQNDLKLLIRAHECVMEGSEFHFENKCLTVFSASNYCGLMANKAAVIRITNADTYEEIRYPPLKYLKRETIMFRSSERAPRRVSLCQPSPNWVKKDSFEAIKLPQLASCSPSPRRQPTPTSIQIPVGTPPKTGETIRKQQTLPFFKLAARRNSSF